MSCGTCNKKANEALLVESGLPFILPVGVFRVTGVGGRRYAISTCLVPPMHPPRGGWGVTVTIKGQQHSVVSDPRSIFKAVKRLFDLNDVPYTDLDIWFNLNLQWTAKAVEKYQKVYYSHLIALAIPTDHYNEQVQ